MKRFARDVIMGRNQSIAAQCLKPLLFILSLIYQLVQKTILAAYKFGIFQSCKPGKPVISVGNLAVGGAGKTPFVIYLSKKIRQMGKQPVILTRGYMSDGSSPSDEAQMIRRQLPGVKVYASPDRVASAQKALKEKAVDVFLMDDGFQHWRVKKDWDLVLLDATSLIGNAGVLPYGNLREPASALKRAHAIVLTKTDCVSIERIQEIKAELNRAGVTVPIIESIHAPTCLEEVGSTVSHALSEIKGPVVAFSGLASADGFIALLKALGTEVAHHEDFLDHHTYTALDIQKVIDLSKKLGVKKIVTTEKDAVKIASFQSMFKDFKVFVLKIEIKITRGEDEFNASLHSVLSS